MTWVAVAIGGAAVVGAVGAGVAGSESASAASNAAQTSANATENAAQLQYQLGEQGLKDIEPFYQAAYPLLPYETAAGLEAYQKTLPQMEAIATNYTSSPLTQTQMQGTTDSINNALSARGLYNSGAGVQAISGASQNIMANQEQNQWNRLGQVYGLQTGTTSATGANTASQAASTSANLGSNLASTYMTGAGQQIQALEFGGQSQANMYGNMGGLAMGAGQGIATNMAMQQYLQGLQSGYTPGQYTQGNLASYGNSTGTGWE
jgi:hypothetical protein